MGKKKEGFRRVPGWLIWVVIAGGLYLTGLHTEVIGQVQRVILATGLIKPHVELLSRTATTDPDAGQKSELALPVANYDFTLKSMQSKIFPMASLKGKVVFMNLWATWCPPCIAEMPNIQSLYDKIKSDEIAFVMVSLDKDPARAQKFMQRKEFTFPVYFLNEVLPEVYAAGVIPTFVLSPEGRVVAQK